MAGTPKANPSYDTVRHSGVASTGGDNTADKLAPYDAVKYSGVSTVSQESAPAVPAATPANTDTYQSGLLGNDDGI